MRPARSPGPSRACTQSTRAFAPAQGESCPQVPSHLAPAHRLFSLGNSTPSPVLEIEKDERELSPPRDSSPSLLPRTKKKKEIHASMAISPKLTLDLHPDTPRFLPTQLNLPPSGPSRMPYLLAESCLIQFSHWATGSREQVRKRPRLRSRVPTPGTVPFLLSLPPPAPTFFLHIILLLSKFSIHLQSSVFDLSLP